MRLNILEILNFGRTCKRYQQITNDPVLWHRLVACTFNFHQPLRQSGWKQLFQELSSSWVYTWGDSSFGRLGHPFTLTRRPDFPHYLPTNLSALRGETIIDLQCGGWSFLALTNQGRLFACGRMQGDTFRNQTNLEPGEVPLPEPIKQMAAGRSFVLLWGKSDSLYILGDFKYQPYRIQLVYPFDNVKVTGISAGWAKAAVTTSKGIYVWDVSRHLDPFTLSQSQTTMVELCPVYNAETNYPDVDITGVAIGTDFLVYLTHEGDVFKAELPSGALFEDIRAQLIAFKLPLFKGRGGDGEGQKLTYISGAYLNFAVFNTSGLVLCGNHSMEPTTEPTVIPELQNCGVLSVTWGDYHALALKEDGTVLSWGKELNFNGCLGQNQPDIAVATVGARREGTSLVLERPTEIADLKGVYAYAIAAGGWQSGTLALPPDDGEHHATSEYLEQNSSDNIPFQSPPPPPQPGAAPMPPTVGRASQGGSDGGFWWFLSYFFGGS